MGQQVMVCNMRPRSDWIEGIIGERLSPLSYLVETKRHAEQIQELSDLPEVSALPEHRIHFH